MMSLVKTVALEKKNESSVVSEQDQLAVEVIELKGKANRPKPF
jgi:hypothetical protein